MRGGPKARSVFKVRTQSHEGVGTLPSHTGVSGRDRTRTEAAGCGPGILLHHAWLADGGPGHSASLLWAAEGPRPQTQGCRWPHSQSPWWMTVCTSRRRKCEDTGDPAVLPPLSVVVGPVSRPPGSRASAEHAGHSHKVMTSSGSAPRPGPLHGVAGPLLNVEVYMQMTGISYVVRP